MIPEPQMDADLIGSLFGVKYLLDRDLERIEDMDLIALAEKRNQHYETFVREWDPELLIEDWLVSEDEHNRRLDIKLGEAAKAVQVHPEAERRFFEKQGVRSKGQQKLDQRRWQRIKRKAMLDRQERRAAEMNEEFARIEEARVARLREVVVRYESDKGKLVPITRMMDLGH